jgi:hypothetical protein
MYVEYGTLNIFASSNFSSKDPDSGFSHSFFPLVSFNILSETKRSIGAIFSLSPFLNLYNIFFVVVKTHS